MKLYEFEGKELFKSVCIPIPKGRLIARYTKGNYILKSQVLHGGRGKAGLIQKNSKAAFSRLKKHGKVLAEELLDIKQEHYLSIRIDRDNNNYQLIYSSKGGIDIESQKNAKTWNFIQLPKLPAKIAPIAKKIFRLLKQQDASLVEINPLIETRDNKLIAADAKVILDDNSLYRHPSYLKKNQQRMDKDELYAEKHGFHYVRLKGNIAVIGNGAGLVMATLDLLKQKKMDPADFLDIGGSAGTIRTKKSLELLHKLKPKAYFINIFGGLTHCDDIAKAIIWFKKRHKVKKPIIVRMIGTKEDEAVKLLSKADILPVRSLDQGIEQLKRIL